MRSSYVSSFSLRLNDFFFIYIRQLFDSAVRSLVCIMDCAYEVVSFSLFLLVLIFSKHKKEPLTLYRQTPISRIYCRASLNLIFSASISPQEKRQTPLKSLQYDLCNRRGLYCRQNITETKIQNIESKIVHYLPHLIWKKT